LAPQRRVGQHEVLGDLAGAPLARRGLLGPGLVVQPFHDREEARDLALVLLPLELPGVAHRSIVVPPVRGQCGRARRGVRPEPRASMTAMLWLSLIALLASGSFDVLVKGGLVYDGTGAPPRRLDVAIRGDRIAALGNFPANSARTVLDASGLAV